MSANDIVLKYVPHPTPLKFHQDYLRKARAICGPFGSGKSVACIEELFFIAMRQEPDLRGNRNVRFGIIRATYPNLKSSTKKTWEKWFPAQWGYMTEGAPMTGRYKIPLGDGTLINMEVLMIAAEDEEDAKKLRSTDFTAIWINEATEVSPDILTAAVQRVGRYPTAHDGDCTRASVLLDYNKPPIGHWLRDTFMLEGMNPDDIFAYFEQPPAAFKRVSDDGRVTYEINPEAENLAILGGKLRGVEGGIEYYRDQVSTSLKSGKQDEVDQLLCMLDVDDRSGKPVWGDIFDRSRHVASFELEPIDGEDVVVAIDTSGIHPFAVLSQFQGRKWAILDELFGEEAGFEEFIQAGVVPLLQTRYANCGSVVAICDPANARDSLKATRPTEVLEDNGIPAKVAMTNDVKPRIEAVRKLLNMDVGGIIISPRCTMTITACAGGYKYPKRKISGSVDVVYGTKPMKDKNSHPADAVQYLALHVLRVNAISGTDKSAVKAALRKRMQAGRLNT